MRLHGLALLNLHPFLGVAWVTNANDERVHVWRSVQDKTPFVLANDETVVERGVELGPTPSAAHQRDSLYRHMTMAP